MNLYVLKFRHYSPKDYEEGIVTYLMANSDEEIYEWFKTGPTINDNTLFNSYEDREKDDETYEIYDEHYEPIGTEKFKERMLRLGGEMFDGDASIDDAYYGVTLYGWEVVRKNVDIDDVQIAKEKLGISIIDARVRKDA